MTILTAPELARRLEEADALAGARFAEALARLRPATAAAAEPIAGGYAVYAGVGHPCTRGVGLGMDGPVSEADLDRMESFFGVRGVPTEVEVCPLAARPLLQMLGARGYRVTDFDNILARPLDKAEMPAPPAGIVARPAEPDEIDLWARTVARGFFDPDEAPAAFQGIFETSGRVPGTRPFLAFADGRPAGGGLLMIHRGLARLAGSSTLLAFRRRGVHTALILGRLALAASERCDLATLEAPPGSVSQRIAERQGFRVVYTRAKMRLDHRGGAEVLFHY